MSSSPALPDPADRALDGESVVITRHDRPVVEIRALQEPARIVSADDLDWLAVHRIGRAPAASDAGSLVSRMRDDDER